MDGTTAAKAGAPPQRRQAQGVGVDDYRVQLEVYNGPMDLLLYLIRRDEIDIHDIPIARLTEQYLAYVSLLQRIDPESAGEFLVLAAMLIEIKSRSLLPRPPALEESEEDFADPRLELVRQLLQYKTYKDAARALELSAQIQALKHPRQPVLPEVEEDAVDIEDLRIWDLLEAFQRLLDETGQGEPFHQVAVDDTPIALFAEDILDSLERASGVQPFADVFAGRTKGEMIGLFLALLELIRERRVQARQETPLGPILLYLLDATPIYGATEHYGPRSEGEDAGGVIEPQGWGKGIGDDAAEVEEALTDEEFEAELGEEDAFALPPEVVPAWEARLSELNAQAATTEFLDEPEAPATESDGHEAQRTT